MSELKELYDHINQRDHDDQYWHVNQYRLLMEPTINDLRRTREGFSRLDSRAITRTAKEAMAKYPKYEQAAPVIKKATSYLHSCCNQALKTLENRPAELQRMLDKFLNRQPEDFTGLNHVTAANLDKVAAAPLIDSHKGLESLPDEIVRLTKEIDGLVSRAVKRERHGEGHRLPDRDGAIEPSRSDDGEESDGFDPRFE